MAKYRVGEFIKFNPKHGRLEVCPCIDVEKTPASTIEEKSSKSWPTTKEHPRGVTWQVQYPSLFPIGHLRGKLMLV
ncbi:hypothetical protein UA08_06526 [Talaromyces atroroseus]|uniref:Uncharacterized protein n=1 Tax=Talaromyces atroroseus TaxID=1441469 RepID=A0A225AC64_TALAT|nr:hypothetical protein UA08_06526 [Talaromyces atroroseus]OKL57950.1 hypothetical protein UA08_06526 [Talaromyces atroroseus]